MFKIVYARLSLYRSLQKFLYLNRKIYTICLQALLTKQFQTTLIFLKVSLVQTKLKHTYNNKNKSWKMVLQSWHIKYVATHIDTRIDEVPAHHILYVCFTLLFNGLILEINIICSIYKLNYTLICLQNYIKFFMFI